MELKKFRVFRSLDPWFLEGVKYASFIGAFFDGQARAGILVMTNKDVYSIAANGHYLSLLGIAEPDKAVPNEAVKIQQLCGKGIKQIASGASHVVALTEDGHVYQWGEGNGLTKTPELLFGNLDNKMVVQIACGLKHSLCLTSEGRVFTWGDNTYGALGLRPDDFRFEQYPRVIPGDHGFMVRAATIDCGQYSSYALDVDGNVWSWGRNNGSLGYADPGIVAAQRVPKLIVGLRGIKKLVAGDRHVLALSTGKELFFWGAHLNEQTATTVPERMNLDLGKVLDMGTTRGCTFSALKTSTSVFFWGLWYGTKYHVPRETSFATVEEVFSAADPPVLCGTVEFKGRGQLILESLMTAFDDQETSDVKFSVEGEIIHAHKSLLRFRSEHFQRMFEHEWKESVNDSIIQFDRFTYRGFRAFIYYLYTDRIESLPVNDMEGLFTELLQIADYFGEQDCYRRCQELLKACVNVKNVCDLYGFAIQYNARNLEGHCQDFMVPVFTEVVEQGGFAALADEYKTRLMVQLAARGVFRSLPELT